MTKTIDAAKLARAFRAAADAADPMQNQLPQHPIPTGAYMMHGPVDTAAIERQRTVSAVLSAIAGVFEAVASGSDKEIGRPGITAEEIQTIQQGESS